MTMMTSFPKTLDPDQECGICGLKRDEHGDSRHEFNAEGILIPKAAPEPPRQQPPSERGAALLKDPTTGVMLRTVERLIQKGLLEGDDLVYIFGGGNANS